jgi:intracellular sulfur oxidation DsrE/DsrF family protein
MSGTADVPGRRVTLKAIGLGIAASVAGLTRTRADPAEATGASLLPPGATLLEGLTMRLSEAPRSREFWMVPMILNDPEQWDHDALVEVVTYHGEPRQVWDNTDIAGPWLNAMRNALNTQIWAFGHADFLVVSATRGTAHLALFDPLMWRKYNLAKLTGDRFQHNTLAEAPARAMADPDNYENIDSPFSPRDNNIPTLQQRGVVFLACHNAIFDLARQLIIAEENPDNLSHAALAAELTNHLIDGVVLTPGVAGTLAELQRAGFTYAA